MIVAAASTALNSRVEWNSARYPASGANAVPTKMPAAESVAISPPAITQAAARMLNPADWCSVGQRVNHSSATAAHPMLMATDTTVAVIPFGPAGLASITGGTTANNAMTAAMRWRVGRCSPRESR